MVIANRGDSIRDGVAVDSDEKQRRSSSVLCRNIPIKKAKLRRSRVSRDFFSLGSSTTINLINLLAQTQQSGTELSKVEFEDIPVESELDVWNLPGWISRTSLNSSDASATIFLTAFFTALLEKLASADLFNLSLPEGIYSRLHTWTSKLELIEAVLSDAEEKQITTKSVNMWLQQHQDLAYGLDDLLDELATEALRSRLMMAQPTQASNPSNCQVLVRARNFTSQSNGNTLQISSSKSAKIKISGNNSLYFDFTPVIHTHVSRISIVVPETLLSLTGAVIASTSPSLISKYCTLLLVSESEESTGEVISAITYQIIPADTQYAEIPLAAVSSIHQHKGIGCLVYSELRKRLQNVGIRTVLCWGDAESNIFWLKRGFVPVGEVNTKGRAQRLPIKANVRKALCFPGGSTLLVSHINKGSEVNPLQPVKLSILNKGPGRGMGAEVDPSIPENLRTFGKENSLPEELMKGCCNLIPLDGGDGEMANDLGLSQMEADGDVRHCTWSALGAKKRIWETSHTSLKSKKVKGGHQIDCQFGSGNASRSDRTHDYCSDGSTLDTSRNISLLNFTSTNPIADNHLEKDVLEDRSCLRVMMMNISDDAKKSSLTKNIHQFMNLSLAIYLAGVLVVTAIRSSMIIEDLGGTVASDGNEMPFILEDEDYKLKYRIDLKDAMLRAKASPQALLKGYDVCLAAHVHPTVSTLSAIVRSAGGNVISGLDKVNEASKTIFVASEENMEEALSANLSIYVYEFGIDDIVTSKAIFSQQCAVTPTAQLTANTHRGPVARRKSKGSAFLGDCIIQLAESCTGLNPSSGVFDINSDRIELEQVKNDKGVF
ncbi:hypothetical protein RJ640_015861 [Escallonia rubra]|uniref:Disease resistance N-terminal domain-containing protein n=1 Tax=Escallonia rubra TaxID=112253 RepID=A0AA88RM86_9ASTE|nr:hypothetical protein RJ640_015861 [Escallonia rubra]